MHILSVPCNFSNCEAIVLIENKSSKNYLSFVLKSSTVFSFNTSDLFFKVNVMQFMFLVNWDLCLGS